MTEIAAEIHWIVVAPFTVTAKVPALLKWSYSIGGGDGRADLEDGTGSDGGASDDDSGEVGASGGVANDNVLAVAARDGEQLVDRGEDGGGSWRCNGGEGGGEVDVDREGGGSDWGPGRGQPERRSSTDECLAGYQYRYC